MKNNLDQYLRDIEQKLSQAPVKPVPMELGYVEEIRDGVVIARGMDNVT